MATPTAYGSSLAGDQIRATAEIYVTVAEMPDP